VEKGKRLVLLGIFVAYDVLDVWVFRYMGVDLQNQERGSMMFLNRLVSWRVLGGGSLFIYFLLLLFAAQPISAMSNEGAGDLGGTAQSVTPSYKTVGYYPSWAIYDRKFNPSDIKNVDKLTHLFYAFAKIQDGEITLADPWADVRVGLNGQPSCWDANTPDEACRSGNFAALQKLKKAYPKLKLLISVGGADETQTSHFAEVASTPERREKFAKSIVRFLQHWQFDGVDIDWEFPKTLEQKDNFTKLMKEIRAEFNISKGNFILVASIGPGLTHAAFIDGTAVSPYVDFFNFMAYDYNGAQFSPTTGHNAPLYYDENAPKASDFYIDRVVDEYLKLGIPNNKLLLGIPLYSRSFGGVTDLNNGEYQPFDPNKTIKGSWDYTGIYDLTEVQKNDLNKNGFTRYWNSLAKAPYLFNPTQEVFITYDDPESIHYKTDYIKAQELGGAVFWELSGDREGSLLAETYKELKDPNFSMDDFSVAKDRSELNISYTAGDGASQVTQNISLPKSGQQGSVITWVSGDSNIVTNEGRVKRPIDHDRVIRLTANVSKGSVSEVRNFQITVIKANQRQ
jgi:chitinase